MSPYNKMRFCRVDEHLTVLTSELSSLVCLTVHGHRLKGCSSSQQRWDSVLVWKAFGKIRTHTCISVNMCKNVWIQQEWLLCHEASLCLCLSLSLFLSLCVHPKSGLCAPGWKQQGVSGTSTDEYPLDTPSQVRSTSPIRTWCIHNHVKVIGRSRRRRLHSASKSWPFKKICT